MNFAWLVYSGLSCGLSLAEVLVSTPGEIGDLVACKAIENGAEQKINLSFDECIKVG